MFEADKKAAVVPACWIWKLDGKVKCRWVPNPRHIEKAEAANPKWPVYVITKFLGKKTSKNSFDLYI